MTDEVIRDNRPLYSLLILLFLLGGVVLAYAYSDQNDITGSAVSDNHNFEKGSILMVDDADNGLVNEIHSEDDCELDGGEVYPLVLGSGSIIKFCVFNISATSEPQCPEGWDIFKDSDEDLGEGYFWAATETTDCLYEEENPSEPWEGLDGEVDSSEVPVCEYCCCVPCDIRTCGGSRLVGKDFGYNQYTGCSSSDYGEPNYIHPQFIQIGCY
jgi:hypothetical protein